MKIGDWVYSCSQGLWQITRIVEYEGTFPEKSILTTIFCKRLLNKMGKRSFSVEAVSPYFIKPISNIDEQLIKKFITENPKVFKEFISYYKPIDSILNLAFYVKDAQERNDLKNIIKKRFGNISGGFLGSDIAKNLSDKAEDNRSTIRNFTAQFVSIDFEIVNSKLIYRQVNVLDF